MSHVDWALRESTTEKWVGHIICTKGVFAICTFPGASLSFSYFCKKKKNVRPCVRRKFLNFLFLRVSEKSVFQSSEIFAEITSFFELAKILWKTLEKCLEIISCFWVKKLKAAVSKNPKLTKILEFVPFWTFRKLQKMTFNLNFKNCKKLVPTQKPTQMFGLMQDL